MASKIMIKNTIALVLAINLVFVGFTVAQAPPPLALSCPRDIQVCVRALGLVGNVGILSSQTVRQCCTLVAGLDGPMASECLCNAIRIKIVDIININLTHNRLLNLCGVAPPQPGFRCA